MEVRWCGNQRIWRHCNQKHKCHAGESLSGEVQMISGGIAYSSLGFDSGCCSRAPVKPWPESRLGVFIHTLLLQCWLAWSRIIGLCVAYTYSWKAAYSLLTDKCTSAWREASLYRCLEMNRRRIHHWVFFLKLLCAAEGGHVFYYAKLITVFSCFIWHYPQHNVWISVLKQ